MITSLCDFNKHYLTQKLSLLISFANFSIVPALADAYWKGDF